MERTKPRLHGLDALRGFAALSVVLWHWQHFQRLGTSRLLWLWDSAPLSHDSQPLFAALRPFYTFGYLGVDFFFLISGFVFFRLYSRAIAEGTISAATFAFWRFSRLYPLYFVTLIFVAMLQIAIFQRTGQNFIYNAGGLGNFLKSMLLFQVNGPGAAFNGPAWSITIEIIMYGVFFALARTGVLRHVVGPSVMFGIGLLLYPRHQNIASGLSGFFEGGLVCLASSRIERGAFHKTIFAAVAAICLCAWSILLTVAYWPASSLSVMLSLAAHVHPELPRLCVDYVVFPLTILLVYLHESMAGGRYRFLSWLGEISYSSYLLHFPLQLMFALAVAYGVLSSTIQSSDTFLLFFFAILIAASLAAFRVFERPMQDVLRQAWAANRDRPAELLGRSAIRDGRPTRRAGPL